VLSFVTSFYGKDGTKFSKPLNREHARQPCLEQKQATNALSSLANHCASKMQDNSAQFSRRTQTNMPRQPDKPSLYERLGGIYMAKGCVVRSDETLSAFLELERITHELALSALLGHR
jgi:hypothetical protein